MLRDDLGSLLPSQWDTSVGFRLHDRDELYCGPFVDRAPDLVFEASQSSARFLGEFTHGDMLAQPGSWPDVTGNHRPRGILMGRGAGIDTNLNADDVRITDIAPTILTVLGEWIPRYMDGRSLIT
jgi:predicted AlkP superfamily phosphohydrolase/phosphomutase